MVTDADIWAAMATFWLVLILGAAALYNRRVKKYKNTKDKTMKNTLLALIAIITLTVSAQAANLINAYGIKSTTMMSCVLTQHGTVGEDTWTQVSDMDQENVGYTVTNGGKTIGNSKVSFTYSYSNNDMMVYENRDKTAKFALNNTIERATSKAGIERVYYDFVVMTGDSIGTGNCAIFQN